MEIKQTPDEQKVQKQLPDISVTTLSSGGVQPERVQAPEPHRRSYRDLDRPRRSPSPRYRRSRSPRRSVTDMQGDIIYTENKFTTSLFASRIRTTYFLFRSQTKQVTEETQVRVSLFLYTTLPHSLVRMVSESWSAMSPV